MTTICTAITQETRAFWTYLSNVFNYRLVASEIGITNHIVFFITSFYNGNGLGGEVYAKNAKNEPLRGADIDLFIQLPNGRYRFYMLQAKVMDFYGRYGDIEQWQISAQYNTLITRSIVEKATPYYLLYNGKTINSTLGNINYGLSCVHARSIARFRHTQYLRGAIPRGQSSLSFDMLFPEKMFPFYQLFCRTPSPYFHSRQMEITGDEIYKGYPYVRIDQQAPITEDNDQRDGEDSTTSLAQYRIILPYSKHNG